MAVKLASGHTGEMLEGEEAEGLKKRFFCYVDGVMKLYPGGWTIVAAFARYADRIFNFEVRPTDIYVVEFPRSGSSWVEEIIWTLVHSPDLDHPMTSTQMDEKSHYLEGDIFQALTGSPRLDPKGNLMSLFNKISPGKHETDGLFLDMTAHAPSPRMIRTHLSLSLLPPEVLERSKVVYIARDPRDAMTSLYHFMRLHALLGFTGTLQEFVNDFLGDKVPFIPCWSLLREAWEKRNHPNMCFLFYEDLKTDTFSQVQRIDKFFGTNRSDKQIENIVRHTSFSQMKERSKENPPTSNGYAYFNKKVLEEEGGYFRKGVVGDWKNRFTPEQVQQINAWMAKNLPQFGEDFKYNVSNS